MPTRDDLLFGQLAVKRGFLSREQMLECLEQLPGEEAEPGPSLEELLREKELLSPEQSDALLTALGRGAQPSLERVGDFEMIEMIGEGSTGCVYKARQTKMDRTVAIKILPPRLAEDEAYINRFLREAKAVARLTHHNIIRIIAAGESDGYFYYAMEHVDGETLAQVLDRDGALAEQQCLDVVTQVASALEQAWRAEIVHGNICPENIMLSQDGEVKLAELGLAREEADEELTETSLALGATHYLSPEQVKDAHDIDIRSDIYSLGATLWHMLVGQPPFKGRSAPMILGLHSHLPSPKESREELADETCRVHEKMMARSPEDRYQAPAELLADLEHVVAGKPPEAAELELGKSTIMPSDRMREFRRSATAKWRERLKEKEPPKPKAGKTKPLVVAACVIAALAIAGGALVMVQRRNLLSEGELQSPEPLAAQVERLSKQGWQIAKGNWRMLGTGVLVTDDGRGGKLRRRVSSPLAEVSCYCCFLEGDNLTIGGPGIILGLSNSIQRAFWQGDTPRQTTRLFEVQTRRWYKLRIRFVDRTAKVFVDGSQIGELTVANKARDADQVFVTAYKAKVCFKDFVVR